MVDGKFRNRLCLLTLCMLGNFLGVFLSSADFFQNCFEIFFSGIPSGCQTVWIQIRPDYMSGLIWVPNVCQDYQQTAKVAAGRQRANTLMNVK